MSALRRFAGCAVVLGLLGAGAAGAARPPAPGARPDARVSVSGERRLGAWPCRAWIEARDSLTALAGLEAAFGRLALADSLLDVRHPGGEVAALDGAPGQVRLSVSPTLIAALATALDVARETEGAWDPTARPLGRAWDLDGAGRVPDRATLNDALERTGWRKVALDPVLSVVRFQSDRMGLDLGGLGRGAALDSVGARLATKGARRWRFDWGGVALVASDGAPWGFDVPAPGDSAPAVQFAVRDGGVAVLDAGARSFEAAGRRFGRVMDCARGEPTPNRPVVAVVASSAARAAALAPALAVMGRQKAGAFAAGAADIGVLWVERDGAEIRAWRWGLPTAIPAPGASVRWME